MAKKSGTSRVPGISDPELLRPRVLKNLLELVDETPPLGERYEEKLKALIFDAYENANGDLGEREQAFLDEIFKYATDYGQMADFFDEPSVSEILVNGPSQIFVEKLGKLILTDAKYESEMQLRFALNHIINPLGRFVNYRNATVDAHLQDGSRVNAVIPPISLVGPTLTIRKFSKNPITVDQLIQFGSISNEAIQFLKACVEARLNILISGGTGSGKTTLLNVMSGFIPDDERILTIENAAELQLRQEHVVTLESRPPNIEGRGEITIRDLVINALRMRPERIIVGECRGGETLDMLQAMNTGHDGSMTTAHANSPRDALSRIETMCLMAGMELPVRAIREQASNAVDLICQQERMRDGTRKVTYITEVSGMEGDVITMTDIFVFEQTGVENGKIMGRLRPTGLRPKFMDKIEATGINLPPSIFGIGERRRY